LYNIVRSHGGTIDKFIGDAMLAYFREPVEAFQASKKMVQESRSVRLKADWNLPIQVRVGLNTGDVALANLGVPEIRQRTILGEAVNFAQRMQSAAPPHSILLSERTLRYLPHTMIRTLEPIQVEIKGRHDQVTAYLWTTSSDRREEIHDQLSMRASLLKTNQRTSLMDRLRRPER
jgi:class 3 adenylate cyclase